MESPEEKEEESEPEKSEPEEPEETKEPPSPRPPREPKEPLPPELLVPLDPVASWQWECDWLEVLRPHWRERWELDPTFEQLVHPLLEKQQLEELLQRC